jgi:peroxiredoxin
VASEQVPPERARTDFDDLPGTDGQLHSLSELAGQRATVLVFTSNSCPTARSYEDRLMRLQRRWHAWGVQLIAINSNNPHLSPADTLPEMTRRSAAQGYNFPYLKDADGAVARGYGALCTPHAIVLDGDRTIVYSGRIDDSRTGNTIRSRDLEAAVSNLIAGRPVPVGDTEPFGCSIVW